MTQTTRHESRSFSLPQGLQMEKAGTVSGTWCYLTSPKSIKLRNGTACPSRCQVTTSWDYATGIDLIVCDSAGAIFAGQQFRCPWTG